MKSKKRKVLLLIGFFLLLMMSSLHALAASNTVPSSRLSQQEFSITANDLKPPECAGLFLTDIYLPNETDKVMGSNTNDLVLGSTTVKYAKGKKGNDCLLSGGGTIDKFLQGRSGDDVLINMGEGSCIMNGGQGNDICYQNGGNCEVINCETVYP